MNILDLSTSLDGLKKINSIYSLIDIWANLLTNIKNSTFFPQLEENSSLYSEIELNCDLEDFQILDDYWNESIQQLDNKIKNYPNWEEQNLQEGDFLEFADAGESFKINSEWVRPWYNTDLKTYSEIRGIDKFIKILISNENLQFTHKKENEWIRLIMPKNSRRVEIEDLNRNFWVIGQSTSVLLQYLFSNEAPLKEIFKDMLSEVSQLWNNVGYLWANYYSIMSELYTKIQIIFAPITHTKKSYNQKDNRLNAANTYSLHPYYYDNLDSTNFKGIFSEADYKSYFWEYIEKYPDSNLIIVPYYRNDNYKHNYFSQVIFPGLLYFDRNQGAEKIKTAIGQLDKQQGFVFKQFYSNAPFKNNNVIVSLRNDNSQYGYNIDLQPFVYGIQEVEEGYRLLRPFSAGEVIQEDNPSKYYGLLRFVPDIEAHYEKGIVIDKFEINFYDAARELLKKDSVPILTLAKNKEMWSSENSDSKYSIIQKSINRKLVAAGPSNLYTPIGEKFYMGDLISWYTKTTEKELLEIIDKIDIAGTGMLIKIGNFLPKATLNNETKIATINSGIKKANNNGATIDFGGGTWYIKHQYHTIDSNNVEPTAYELNLNFQLKQGNTAGNASSFLQDQCYYYYPIWDNTRWTLESLNTSNPSKDDIISTGLKVIKSYMEIGKEIRYQPNQTSISEENLTNLFDNGTLDYEKITYFIGCIGIYPWENSKQFYWSSNLLFGIFYYIPKPFIKDVSNFKNRMEVIDGEGDIRGYVIYSALINKIEKAFNIGEDYYFTRKANNSNSLYYPPKKPNLTTWRLPKVYPSIELSSAIQVNSNKKGEQYFSLTDKLLNLYKKGYYDIIYEYIRQGNLKPMNREEFINNSVNRLLSENKGVWTVFDGNFIFNNNEDNVKQNIHFYNKDNLVRQVAEVNFSIVDGKANFSKVLLRKYDYNTNNGEVIKDSNNDWNYRNGDQTQIFSNQDVLIYDENGENIKNVRNIISGTKQEIDEAIWNNGVAWESSSNYEIQENVLNQLKNGNSIKYVNGIDISAKNYLRDGEDSYLEFEENVDWNLIDWNTLAENNVKFVILRAAETSTGIIDKAFEHSYEEAKRVGISVGAYYVSYATTQKEAEIEAERFNNILKNKQFDYPVFMSYKQIISDNGVIDSKRTSNKNSKVIIESFLKRMKDLGYCCGLYYNQSYINKMNDTELDSYISSLKNEKMAWQTFQPEENEIENYLKICVNNGIWQYAINNKNTIGINNEDVGVNRNITCYDYPTYIKESGYNGYLSDKHLKLIETIKW